MLRTNIAHMWKVKGLLFIDVVYILAGNIIIDLVLHILRTAIIHNNDLIVRIIRKLCNGSQTML